MRRVEYDLTMMCLKYATYSDFPILNPSVTPFLRILKFELNRAAKIPYDALDLSIAIAASHFINNGSR